MTSLTTRIWERLGAVKTMSFTARSEAARNTGWRGKAKGKVEVQTSAPDCLLFLESGSWSAPAGRKITYSNLYRWTLHGASIRLEHLRLGVDRPVHLVDLVPDDQTRMISSTPHICAADRYRAFLELGEELRLNWSVTGPNKQETIDCIYSSAHE